MKREEKHEIARAFALVTQLGISMGTCIVIGLFAGKYLDRWLGTQPWMMLAGILIGVLSAFKVLYDLAMKNWKK